MNQNDQIRILKKCNNFLEMAVSQVVEKAFIILSTSPQEV